MTITDTNWCQSKLLKRQKLILFADIKVFSMLNRSSLPVFVLSFLMVPDRDRRCLINEGYAERVWLKYSQESCSTVLIPVCVCPVSTYRDWILSHINKQHFIGRQQWILLASFFPLSQREREIFTNERPTELHVYRTQIYWSASCILSSCHCSFSLMSLLLCSSIPACQHPSV